MQSIPGPRSPDRPSPPEVGVSMIRVSEQPSYSFCINCPIVGERGARAKRAYREAWDRTKPDRIVEAFWDALGIQQQWINKPELMWDDPIWKITAKEGFLFDDSFWGVFARFPFRICHVSYSGAPWSQESGPPEMVMRFTLRGEEYADATG